MSPGELDGTVRETSSVLNSESANISPSKWHLNSHSLQETKRSHKQRTETNGLKNKRPLLVGRIVGVRLAGDSKAGTGAADGAKEHEVDPSELSPEAVAYDDEGGEEEYRDIDAKLYDGDDFLAGSHLSG